MNELFGWVHRNFERLMYIWLVMAFAVGLVICEVAHAEQVCTNQYDPLNGVWHLVCVERDSQVSGPPVTCRMIYDAINGVWIQVCQ